MIRVDVQPYCNECCDFESDVTKPMKQLHRTTGTDEVSMTQTDTIIRCKHAKRCESIKRYLEKQPRDKE